MKHFNAYNKQDVLGLTHIRRFETKLGERVLTLQDKRNLEASLQQAPVRYVVFGIAEDIGVRANYGKAGAATAWRSFLSAFLNQQSNDFLDGSEMLVAGHFDFGELQSLIEKNAHDESERIDAWRHAVITIDEEVEEFAKLIAAAGKIPVAIGGGHNNAYPLIKGCAKGLYNAGRIPLAQINCINLDAHTDFGPSEGRHSGNGFRYAEEDGYLQKYCAIGVHEGDISQNVWLDIVNNPFIDLITYEDIFLLEKRSFIQAVAHAVGFTGDNFTGIELDLDSIERVLSSTSTPCGLSPLQARQYVGFASAQCEAAYLHICEGAQLMENGSRDDAMGLLISYLVGDFIKASD